MQYSADREDPAYNTWPEPTIAEMVEKAIAILSKHETGYFLAVEGKPAMSLILMAYLGCISLLLFVSFVMNDV